jgi:ABC-2 type transport system permease protein
MLTGAKNQIKISLLSIKYALQREMLNKITFFSNIIFMILNNGCFLVQWIILYAIKDGIGGYSFRQVLLLWGLAASTFGFSHFFFKDSYSLSSSINEGRLDNYLVQPKNVLLSLITSSVEVACIGDMLYGYIMLFLYGIDVKSFILFTVFTILGGIIITSMAVIWGSLSFWFGKVDMLANTMNSLPTNFATYPDGIFKGLVKILFYTIIPIGFANYMPIQLITDFNIFYFIIVIVATILCVSLAYLIFYLGLKKYSSSNLMNVRI